MSFENAALSADVAKGLREYGDLVFSHYQTSRQLPVMVEHFTSLGMGTQANRAAKLQRSMQEMTVTGHFLEFAGAMIRDRHPVMGSPAGMEMLRQYSRALMAYYFADVDEERREALGRQVDEYDTAIRAAAGATDEEETA